MEVRQSFENVFSINKSIKMKEGEFENIYDTLLNLN
jgi:hypothetical protein